MRTLTLMLLLSLPFGLALANSDANNKIAAASARVAGGQVVSKAQSEKSSAQWAARRPGYKRLNPGKTH